MRRPDPTPAPEDAPFIMATFLRTLTTALVLTAGVAGLASPASGAAGFGDVEDGRFYTEPITWLVSEGITTGTEEGCFSPYARVTRGQIVTFLYRLETALGNAPEAVDHPFADVIATYQQAPVGWAHAEQITLGTSVHTFSPDAHVTRGDFAVLLWRYAGRPTPSTGHDFVDVVNGYQQTAVAWMAETGVTVGTSTTTFSPDGRMTRAEAATFLHRFMGEPPVSLDPAVTATTCLIPIRTLLETNGLTPTEARCAAGHLRNFEVDDLAAVLDGDAPLGLDLLASIALIVGDGCVAPERYSVVLALLP